MCFRPTRNLRHREPLSYWQQTGPMGSGLRQLLQRWTRLWKLLLPRSFCRHHGAGILPRDRIRPFPRIRNAPPHPGSMPMRPFCNCRRYEQITRWRPYSYGRDPGHHHLGLFAVPGCSTLVAPHLGNHGTAHHRHRSVEQQHSVYAAFQGLFCPKRKYRKFKNRAD